MSARRRAEIGNLLAYRRPISADEASLGVSVGLLQLLRVSHPMPDGRFAIDQIETAKLLGWASNTLKDRIRVLIEAKLLIRVHFGKGLGNPHLYELR